MMRKARSEIVASGLGVGVARTVMIHHYQG
jgi:hypothetical protein